MDSKRLRLKLAKRLSKVDFESTKHVDLPEECCIIDDNDGSKLKRDGGKYR